MTLITNPSSAHESLLDRGHAENAVETLFGDALAVFRELIDEATHLQVRAMKISSRDTPDVVILATLFSRIIKLLDGIEIQCRAGQVYAARITLRVLLEGVWGLEWMLKSDTARRGRQYYVVDQRDMIAENETFIAGTRACERFWKDVTPEQVSGVFPADVEERARVEIERLKSHIESEPELLAINEEVDRQKRSPPDIRWFQLYSGPESYRELARVLGRGDEYQLGYNGLSHAVHGTARHDHVWVERSGLARLVGIRAFTNVPDVLDLAFTLGLRAYRLVLMHYRPDELAAFRSRFFPQGKSRFEITKVELQQEVKIL